MSDTDGTTPAEATMAIDIIWNPSTPEGTTTMSALLGVETELRTLADDLIAKGKVIAARAAAAERERIRRRIIEGDPGPLELALRDFLDVEDAAECAGIVADLLAATRDTP